MALFASGIKLQDSLKDPLRQVNQIGQDKLTAALGKIGARQTVSNRASGRPMGTYAPGQLAQAGQTASTGIEDALTGALGNTSYDEYNKNLEQERNLALAKEVGSLNSPSTLEQVLGGLGGGAKAGGQFAALYKALNRGGGAGGLPPSLSLYGNGSGLARYS